MNKNDIEQMMTIIHEIFDAAVKVFEKYDYTQGSKVDFILTKVFVSFYANSILNVDKENREKYIEKRTDLIAEEIAVATRAILNHGDDIANKLEGVCTCDKCKNRNYKEDEGQTIH